MVHLKEETAMTAKKAVYVEPADYFPPELLKMFDKKARKDTKPKEAKPALKKNREHREDSTSGEGL